ncbi:MAG TPA: acyloxyacyl hydrolase [Verrucomicrobiae bacterium]|nr:acyloxyacyl hydrolase [Verrucomicrobiae bacterium]
MRRLIAISFLIVACPGLALAQSSSPENQGRSWDFGVWAAGQTGRENTKSFTEAQLLSAGIFVGKVVTGEMRNGWSRGRIEYAADISPLFIQFTPEQLYGIRFEPVILRWNFSQTRRYKPYVEMAGGAVRTNKALPAYDTSDFNFTARAGGGLRMFAGQRRYLDLGWHWSHVSNANLGVRNPAFNGIEMVVGFHWLR